MAKTDLKKHLRLNPKAKKHAKVIKDTLKALDALKEAGVVERAYGLGSPYGGSKVPTGAARNRLSGLKMTYCA